MSMSVNYLGPLGTVLSGAIETATDCILSHPTAQKIVLGSGLVLTGGAGLMRSGVSNLLPSYFSNRKVEPINYSLAGASTVAIGAGAFMIYLGIMDLYGEEPFSSSPSPSTLTSSTTETESSADAPPPAVAQPAATPPPVSNNMCETNPDLCKNNLGIPREQMPQSEGPATESFLEHLSNKNITVIRNAEAHPSSYFATQSEINAEKVNGMVKSANMGTFDPCKKEILVSSYDNHVVDGHHRWAACLLLGRKMTIASIFSPIRSILGEASTFPGIKREGFNFFSNRA